MKSGIVVSVDGGLGDQVCAEPAVRYLVEKVFPGWDVHIAAGIPRVFEHLKDRAKVYGHNEFNAERELGYQKRFTFPTTGVLREAVCFLTTHMVDYHAAALLLRHLPLKDKEIQLAVVEEDEIALTSIFGNGDFSKLILVHAGKSWQTKTFPLAWWQEVVDQLSLRGYQVCLIGKDDAGSNTGTLNIIPPQGSIDLRNKLSFGPLLGLLSRAPLLVSNDTSLIQMAGAFNNHIILIASCKHPDFVLPYRNGSPYYKASALYKKLLIDDLPFEPVRDGVLRVDVPVLDWRPYLPDPEIVVEEVISRVSFPQG